MREGAPAALTGVPKRQNQLNDAIPRVAPKWLKHDRQVSGFLSISPDCPIGVDRREGSDESLVLLALPLR